MLSNYLKLAWRVLGRRKFFTFISLFGISFTLGMLMTTLSFLQSELGTNAPLTHKNDMVLMDQIRLTRIYYDTLTIVDTVMENGVAVYDTTFDYKESGKGMSQTEFNNGIIEDYLMDIPSAKHMCIMSNESTQDVYIGGVKLTLKVLLADAGYWQIFDHNIVEGRTFDSQEVENASLVMVISTKTAEEYFGRTENVVGEEMFVEGRTYKVIGVYEHKGKFVPFVSPSVVTPYTNYDMSKMDNFYFGVFSIIYRKKEGVSSEQVKEDIRTAASKIPLDHPDNHNEFNLVELKPKTYNEMYAQAVYYEDDAEKSYGIMKWVLLGLLSFFIILPTLNLINLNVSRIMDRSSEIGVRKAFGAHQGNIISQFVIENIVQTILGGIIGFGIAWLLITVINQGGYLGNSVLILNMKFFLYSFLVTMIFGIVSGLLPAIKMSRLQIVNALKENKL